MILTVGELRKYLYNLSDDTVVRFQWIEDKYILGKKENGFWGNTDLKSDTGEISGWKTYDMPCDNGTCSRVRNREDISKICINCPNRNRYIGATRCFVYKDELFIDGHF